MVALLSHDSSSISSDKHDTHRTSCQHDCCITPNSTFSIFRKFLVQPIRKL